MFEDTAIKRHKMREKGVIALDWQSLYDWAESQPAGAILGESRTNTVDPLGNYLNEQTGVQRGYWSIGPSIKNGYQDRLSKPDWVTRLIEETDDVSGQSEPIRREEYLAMLARVKPSWVTEIDQRESLTLIEQSIKELDDDYQMSMQAVQVWLRQRGVDLPLWRVKGDMEIVRNLMPSEQGDQQG